MDNEVSRSIIRDIDLVSMSHPFALHLDPIDITREKARRLAEEILQVNTESPWVAKEPTQFMNGPEWAADLAIRAPVFTATMHNCRCTYVQTRVTLWQRVRRWLARLLRKIAAKFDDQHHYHI